MRRTTRKLAPDHRRGGGQSQAAGGCTTPSTAHIKNRAHSRRRNQLARYAMAGRSRPSTRLLFAALEGRRCRSPYCPRSASISIAPRDSMLAALKSLLKNTPRPAGPAVKIPAPALGISPRFCSPPPVHQLRSTGQALSIRAPVLTQGDEP